MNRDTLEDLAEVKKNVVGDLRTAIEKKNNIFKKDSSESTGEASTNGAVPVSKGDGLLKSDGRNGHHKHVVDPGKKGEGGAVEGPRRSGVEVAVEAGGGGGGARRRHLSSGEVEGSSTVDLHPHLSHQPMGRLSPCPEQPRTGQDPRFRERFFAM